MHHKITKNDILAVTAGILAVLVLVSGILVCDGMTTIRDNTPSVSFSVDLGGVSGPRSAGPAGPLLAAPMPPALAVRSGARTLKAASSVYDDDRVWRKTTTIDLFRAKYDNDAGTVTVRSAYGDKLVAPGTANSYRFFVSNDGGAPIDYRVDTTAEMTATVDGVTYTIPLEARFYTATGKYLLGSKDGYAPMEELDGLRHTGSLSVKHYQCYTLDWRWPFEGDDTLDTLLGNLAAQGDELTVSVTIQVTASGNDLAVGGLPKTSDSSGIGMWMAVMATSGTMLFILLLLARRKDDDEKERV